MASVTYNQLALELLELWYCGVEDYGLPRDALPLLVPVVSQRLRDFECQINYGVNYERLVTQDPNGFFLAAGIFKDILVEDSRARDRLERAKLERDNRWIEMFERYLQKPYNPDVRKRGVGIAAKLFLYVNWYWLFFPRFDPRGLRHRSDQEILDLLERYMERFESSVYDQFIEKWTPTEKVNRLKTEKHRLGLHKPQKGEPDGRDDFEGCWQHYLLDERLQGQRNS